MDILRIGLFLLFAIGQGGFLLEHQVEVLEKRRIKGVAQYVYSIGVLTALIFIENRQMRCVALLLYVLFLVGLQLYMLWVNHKNPTANINTKKELKLTLMLLAGALLFVAILWYFNW